MKKSTFLSLLLSVLVTGLFAQDPGGITGAELWLKADAGTAPASGTLTGWTDQTGTNNFTISGDPQTGASTINFNNAVDFDGDGDFLSGDAPITFQTLYMVVKKNNTAPGNTVISAKTGTANQGYMGKGDDLRTGNNDGINYFRSTGLLGSASPRLAVVEFVDGQPASGHKSYLDGKFFATTVLAGGGNYSIFSDSPYIGRSQDPNEQDYLDGILAEIIMYPASHSDEERNRIQTYLAVKYGISLGNNTDAMDYTASDGTIFWTANTTYKYDIFGIGYDQTSGLVQQKSCSINTDPGDGTGISGKGNLRIQIPSSFDNGDFLMLGHDNGALVKQVTNIPQSVLDAGFARYGRQWKVQRTGDVGTVDLSFDLQGLVYYPVSGATASNFKLLIDEDGDGDFTTGTVTEVDASAFSSGEAQFNAVSLPDGAVITFANTRATVTWQGDYQPDNTNWNQADNWSPAGVPTAADDVVINEVSVGDGYPVIGAEMTGANAARCNTLKVNSNASLTVNGELILSD